MTHLNRNEAIHKEPGELNTQEDIKPYEKAKVIEELTLWQNDIGLVIKSVGENQLTYDNDVAPARDDQQDLLDALEQVQEEIAKLVNLSTLSTGIVAGQRQYKGSSIVTGLSKNGAFTLKCSVIRGNITEITVELFEESDKDAYVTLNYIQNGQSQSISGQLDISQDTSPEEVTDDPAAKTLEELI